MYKIFRTIAAALAVVALLVGSISNSHAAGEGGDGVATHEVAPGVFSFRSGSGYHSMFVITDEGVAAFETVNTAHSIEMVKAIRAVTDKPIKYALLSHNHWDHISGGAVMQAVGAKTVMH
jgi:glyoxylase-like metal-dependent hydrolase (beta-lactamase superfamily II)